MTVEKENGSDLHPFIKALDLAWEPSLLIKFLFYCLFVDLGCFQVVGHGLWAVKLQDISKLSIGSICGIFFFWALMLVVLGFIRGIIKLFVPNRDVFRRQQGSVSPSELLTEAVKTDSYVLYNLHIKIKNAQENKIKSCTRLEVTCLGVLLLMGLEWVRAVQNEGGGLFVEWVWHVAKPFSDSADPISQGGIALVACLLSFLSVLVVYTTRNDFTADYIDSHSLHYKSKN
ncbi:hypothetical protein EYY99_02945 [Hafnia alvei]|uniref:hypothetical protein n=1 Tax=Hafnia alvei TaxID=569 RepID=UPI001034CEE2|nr:hypothetical protein [Hafnia alvei]TBL46454.1 hypothetical protein EYY99_02945 [Hafnia alvei]